MTRLNRLNRWRWFALVAFCGFARSDQPNAGEAPPAFPREFRAAWVATVNNIDWPSRPGLGAEAQKTEALAILDLAVKTGLNAVIFQVRTAADALYDSPVEPWSAYLSGKQGENPGYDPLAFWVTEAHARGLLLHAWINPFRARISGAKYEESGIHVARTNPEIVRRYGDALWLDPGEPEARAVTLKVVADLARRYDIDGVHVDDYFYPYPIADKAHPGEELPFPDDASWAKAQASGTTTSRADWRRGNINTLIERMAATVRAVKPRALFGISPFGIARPGLPAGITGFDQYDKLSADAVLWFREGWCDYLAPQLYWKVDAPAQPFRPLLEYWASVNPQGRHLWPGLSISRVNTGPKGYDPEEILRQIAILRAVPASTGSIFFSFKALQANKRGLTDQLRDGPYQTPSLVPVTPWLGLEPPPAPRSVTLGPDPNIIQVDPAASHPFLWAVQQRSKDNTWSFSTHPGHDLRWALPTPKSPTASVGVSSVDRLGNTSDPVWTLISTLPGDR